MYLTKFLNRGLYHHPSCLPQKNASVSNPDGSESCWLCCSNLLGREQAEANCLKKVMSRRATLTQDGITRDQSSKWQNWPRFQTKSLKRNQRDQISHPPIKFLQMFIPNRNLPESSHQFALGC